MARDAQIETRLQRWAQWLTVGDGDGYPVMSTVHPDWTPPSPGMTPTLKASPHSDVRETNRAIEALSMRLRNTLVVHYVQRPTLPEQALRLSCSEATVYARVEEAHQQLLQVLHPHNARTGFSSGFRKVGG